MTVLRHRARAPPARSLPPRPRRAHERGFTRLLCGSDSRSSSGTRRRRGDRCARRRASTGWSPGGSCWSSGVGRRCDRLPARVGRLRRLFPGARAAYAVGHESLTLIARATAAAIVTGTGTAASHWTALALHGLIDRPRPLIHVTSPLQRRPRRGLFIHRAVLPPDEDLDHRRRRPRHLRCPVPASTCRPTATSAQLRTLIKRAEFRDLLDAERDRRDPRPLPAPPRAREPWPGSPPATRSPPGPTLSPLEDDMVEFCGARGIPLPETNAPIRGRRTDAHRRLPLARGRGWRSSSTAATRTQRALAFEDDRERDRALTAAGWRPIRMTARPACAVGRRTRSRRDLRAATRRS